MYVSLPRAAFAVALALTAAACAADAPTVAAPPAVGIGATADLPSGAGSRLVGDTIGGAAGVLGSGAWGLVGCDSLAYAADVQTIGPAGGELRIGPHRLTVPPAALAAPTVITGEAPSSAAVVVRFAPDGLRFARPATLTLSYAHCAPPAAAAATIVQVDDLLRVLGALPSVNLAGGRVAAPLPHFSGYAVAW